MVLDGLTFSVDKGEIFGYLGPNGAGKTTTMRVLLGLLRPTSGSATVLDSDLSKADEIRKRVGVLMENNGLYDRLTARENLEYYARLYDVTGPVERVAELLDFVGLGDRGNELVGNFSTGMKRKMGIARAILHKPEIVFFDEPTSGLDPEAQHMVRELILRLSHEGSMTVFLNSHNLDEVQRICSRVAILYQGRIKALDSVQHLTTAGKKTSFSITLASPGQADEAEGVIAGLAGVGEITRTDNRLEMTLLTAPSHEIVAALVKHGVQVEEARIQKRSLEEIYLDVMRQAEGGVA
ncbi:ABC-2 type transport system ATP-binding protein [Methanolinea mesophila]|uniref:ABC transporter ATP-binding protein n=1 Tax=Methanolinea mesophila TaxID=547055 RepID=UPI001FD755EC|nr:ABC transporter ATP-binding protein [Methanolinea mesophila]MBP1929878.1 ABC-2 type transport system ATP-binding protein [Methanolinea mesophila]